MPTKKRAKRVGDDCTIPGPVSAAVLSSLVLGAAPHRGSDPRLCRVAVSGREGSASRKGSDRASAGSEARRVGRANDRGTILGDHQPHLPLLAATLSEHGLHIVLHIGVTTRDTSGRSPSGPYNRRANRSRKNGCAVSSAFAHPQSADVRCMVKRILFIQVSLSITRRGLQIRLRIFRMSVET